MADEPAPAQEAPQAEAQSETQSDDLTSLVESLRADLNDARSEAAAYRHERNELKKKNETEQERYVREAVERAREEWRTEHLQVVDGYERRLATAAIQAKAADGFSDPGDAVAQLAHSGELDKLLAEKDPVKREQAVDKALAALLEAKPYLGRAAANHRPLVSQGARTEQTSRRERSWLRG